MKKKEQVRESGALPLMGQVVFLRELAPSDVGDRYLSWMQDEEIGRYLESRFMVHTLESLAEFVEKQTASERNWMFAICRGFDGQHIGNIKLGPVNDHHGLAEIGLLVGERSMHGKGIATEAIRLVSRFAFETLDLRRLTAGMYAHNVASRRAFEKCGFKVEGILRAHFRCEDEFVDGWRLGLLREEFM